MKLKKIKFEQILKLHLLHSKAYEHTLKKVQSGRLTEFNLTETLVNLKKALYVIFQFHKAKKRILFIGVPKTLEIKINRTTSHAAVPSNFNLQGVLLNQFKASKKFDKLKVQNPDSK